MKIRFILLILMIIIMLSGCADYPEVSSSSPEQSGMPEVIDSSISTAYTLADADTFLNYMLVGEYGKAYEMCSNDMKIFFVSDEKMGAMWEEILVSVGAYRSHGQPGAAQSAEVMVYTYPAQFETGAYHINISITLDGLIAGLNILPAASNENNLNAQAKHEGPVASTDLPDGIAEKDIVINKGHEHELYGKLTYPADAGGSFPVVVLVHGSGAHDMDESITFENKPFRDIAYSLPQKGVAVLRYHKVTYAYPEDFDQAALTIDMETVNDAVAAKKALLEQAGMDFSGFFVAGHSLGGMMAPRIAQEGDYDGMILLAGSPRNLIDILYDQNCYLIPISGLPQDQIDAALLEVDRLYAEAKEILQLPISEMEGKTAFGLPAVYLHSIAAPSAEQYIRELDMPMLILQGGKDFQVYPDKDFVLYEEITRGLSNVTMIEYDDLNHLFMPSFMDTPDQSEYKTPAKVDAKVLEDMAEWIQLYKNVK